MGDRDRDVFLSAVLAGLEVVGMLAIGVAAGLLGTLIMVTALLDYIFDK